MAVIVKYIVVRNGEEKMTFATKKEADAHDKMLDIADNLFDFLESAKTKLTEDQLEDISLVMAQKRDALMLILRGMDPKKRAPSKPADKPAPKTAKETVKTKVKTKVKEKK
ncbi:MAG: hypothetical protein DRH26_12740 [Deltaproteobacteria bacterium]|nr:MAG: hypothetical protein DRH26_12740 [Deltaproteobacteria bacterium]